MKVNTEPLRIEAELQRMSSKGNQNKWFVNESWYKEDGLGYEALAEVLVSGLLEKTNVNHYVTYKYEPIEKEGRLFHGCKSKNFMTPEDDKLLSVERLFQLYYGESAAKAVLQFADIEDRIRYVTDHIEKCTGLHEFGVYIKKALTLDALFLNEDRHFHNLAVIQKKDGTFRYCPLFDHGASLFSDTKGDYPLSVSLEQCLGKIQAKPFSTDFDQQLDACDILYGSYIFQACFTMKDVDEILSEFESVYEEKILERVRETVRIQMRKYRYLFSAPKN